MWLPFCTRSFCFHPWKTIKWGLSCNNRMDTYFTVAMHCSPTVWGSSIYLTFEQIVRPQAWHIQCLDFAIFLPHICHTFTWHCGKGKQSLMSVLESVSHSVSLPNQQLITGLRGTLSQPLSLPVCVFCRLCTFDVAENLKDQYIEFSTLQRMQLMVSATTIPTCSFRALMSVNLLSSSSSESCTSNVSHIGHAFITSGRRGCRWKRR